MQTTVLFTDCDFMKKCVSERELLIFSSVLVHEVPKKGDCFLKFYWKLESLVFMKVLFCLLMQWGY